MTDSVARDSGSTAGGGRLKAAVLILLALGAVAVLGERLWFAAATPFWLDETWTATIISPPSWAGFWREVWLDCNAPLFYIVARLWSGLFGFGDFALRLPTQIALAAAGLIAARARLPGLSAEARLTWAALVFFWWGVGSFLDARCYGLLIALCTLQAVAFGQLMRAPGLKRALAWVAISALAVFCQYYAVLIGAAQGLVFAAVHRQRALKLWPAALGFAPLAGWIAVHLPRLADYARPDVAWHPRVDAGLALLFSSVTLGGLSLALTGAAVAVICASAVIPAAPGGAGSDPDRPRAPHLTAVAAAALLGLALTLASGVARPTLTPRYLIPIVPSMLLAVVLAARASRNSRLAYAGLALVYMGFAIDPTALAAKLAQGSPYGSEAPSQALIAQGVSDVVFVWDHPVAKIIDPGSLRSLAADSFRRHGAPQVRVIPLVVPAGRDANPAILAAATGPRPGVVWMYDRRNHTAAAVAAPDLARLDPRWTCQVYGDGMTGAVGCYRASGPSRPRP